MYKIPFLLLITFVNPLALWGQQAGQTPATYLPSEIQSSRQATFTAHPLANGVEPVRKHTYKLLTEGQKASLPYPILFQTQTHWLL